MPRQIPNPYEATSKLTELQDRYQLDEAVDFVNACLERYKFSKSVIDNLQEGLRLVQEKRDDQQLNLGVIGEASSGKSTLINAILGCELLTANISLGTTAVATVISYGNEMSIEILYENYSFGYPQDANLLSIYGYDPKKTDLENARNIISYVTTEELVSSLVKEVRVCFPAPILKSGLVIIDTPGVNHQNLRHRQVTSNVIAERCDSAIVVMNATAATSNSLLSYLDEHLRPMLHRCLFVTTQMDVIPKASRPALLGTIEKWISFRLGLEGSKVIAVSSAFRMEKIGVVISNQLDQFGAEERAHFEQDFLYFLDQTFTVMAAKRTEIIFEKVFLILELLIRKVEDQLTELSEEYRQERAALDSSQLEQPAVYAAEQRQIYAQVFRNQALRRKVEVEAHIQKDKKWLRKHARKVVESLESKNELKNNLEGKLKKVFREAAEDSVETDKFGRESLDLVYNAVMELFVEEFDKVYGKLASLNGRLTTGLTRVDFKLSKTAVSSIEKEGLSSVLKIATDGLQESSNAVNTGAILGVLAGIVFPGVGWIFGAAAGILIGRNAGPSLDDIKKKIIDELDSAINEDQRKTKRKLLARFDAAAEAGEEAIITKINEGFKLYDQLLVRMNRRDEKKRVEIDDKMARVSVDQKSAQVYAGKLQEGRAYLAKF